MGMECRLPVGKRGVETTVRSAGRLERGSIMKHRFLVASWIAVLLAIVCGSPGAQAQTTYTWTGAVDGDWENAANWDANGVPVDITGQAGRLGFATSADRIVINATDFSPTTNVPTLRSDHNIPSFVPSIDVINGSVAFSLENTRAGGGTMINVNTFTTIGDGDVNTGLASLTYTNPGTFRRGENRTMAVTVKSDGSLNFGGNTTVSYDGDKLLHVTLAGGSTTFNGTVTPLRNSTAAGKSWFDFTAEGATFTARFGAVFVDLTTVNTFIDDGNFFRASTGLTLAARDNGDNTFTVFIPPPAGTMILLR